MCAKFQIKRLAICAVIAIISIGIGVCNVQYSTDYSALNAVFQSLVAVAAIVAVSELAASLSKFPVFVYILSAVVCAAFAHIVTPWSIILPRVDWNSDTIQVVHRSAVMSSFASYSIALVISVLAGVFFLHRKDIFKSNHS